MKKYASLLVPVLFLSAGISAKDYSVTSPDGVNSVVARQSGSGFNLSLSVGGRLVFDNIKISLSTNPRQKQDKVRFKPMSGSVDEILTPPVQIKAASIRDSYNYLTLVGNQGKDLEIRAYDSGVSWRWIVRSTHPFNVLDETVEACFPNDCMVWNNNEVSYNSENQCVYTRELLSEIPENTLFSTPLMFEISGSKFVFMESGLLDYAGLWFRKSRGNSIQADLPEYPKSLSAKNYFSEKVTSTESFISRHDGPTSFPWRIIAIAENDSDLLENHLVYQLAEPSKGDFSWVRPGKVAWEWLAATNIIGVDFKAGENTRTYKYYVDFASRYGIEYILLDGGWFVSHKGILTPKPDLDVEEVCNYAHSKGVDVLIWAPALLLRENTEEVLRQYKDWGVSGLKIDFFCRDDQPMLNLMTEFAKSCAEYGFIVDFHGCAKPAGLQRTYPNVLNYEAVYGWEQAKTADSEKLLNPDHNVTIPFIRLLAGPMDYTPGAMDNYNKETWHLSVMEPSSIGTRCHQLAMYVIYDAPLQMLADSPYKYYREPLTMDFLSKVPTVWRQSVPLKSSIGEYISMARKSLSGEWFIGAMNNDSGIRNLELPLDFLGEGTYRIRIWKDGVNSDRNPRDVAFEEFEVTRDSRLDVALQTGGGYAAIVVKVK